MVKTVLKTLFISPRKTRSALLTSFLFFGFLLFGCSPEPQESLEAIQLAGKTMGTTYHITLVVEPEKRPLIDVIQLQNDVDEQLKLINQQMSTYIPDSELMQLNAAPVDEWLYISEPLRQVLVLAQEISRKSDGAFDVTVGPLVTLWGFGPAKRDGAPSQEEIDQLRTRVGYQFFEITGHQLRKERDIWIDLSAIAKGFGVDVVTDYLRERGFENLMVEIGGELRLHGVSPRGTPWRIAIEQPEALRGSVRKAIELTNMAMATSGDYRNYFEQDGKRFSHTLNPATGYPIDHRLVSVTVLASTAAEADAWATTINVLGPEEGMRIAEREHLAAYLIIKSDEGFVDAYSSAFEPYK